MVGVAKRPKAPDCGSGIRGFESHHPPHKKEIPDLKNVSSLVPFLGWVMGFEPTNTGTTIRGLRPRGDTHHILFAEELGTPEGTRSIKESLG